MAINTPVVGTFNPAVDGSLELRSIVWRKILAIVLIFEICVGGGVVVTAAAAAAVGRGGC